MNVDECIKQGLLKRDIPSKEKAAKSLEIAKHKLGVARKLFGFKIFEETITNSYSSMFHASRALLFRDGIKEKSHYAVFVYIKEKYSGKLEMRFINEFNNLRTERNEISYGLEKSNISAEEAKEVLKTAEEFIGAVEKLILPV
jgi:uncharacterized protein (UPF0332 family)